MKLFPAVKMRLSRMFAKVRAWARLAKPPRRSGSMLGQIALDDSFFEPLPEDELKAWE